MKWWLSYEGEGELLGVVIAEIDDSYAGQEIHWAHHRRVDKDGFLHACRAAKRAGCSPGGSVHGYPIPQDAPATLHELPTFKLLTREEIEAAGIAVRRIGEED